MFLKQSFSKKSQKPTSESRISRTPAENSISRAGDPVINNWIEMSTKAAKQKEQQPASIQMSTKAAKQKEQQPASIQMSAEKEEKMLTHSWASNAVKEMSCETAKSQQEEKAKGGARKKHVHANYIKFSDTPPIKDTSNACIADPRISADEISDEDDETFTFELDKDDEIFTFEP